MTNKLLTREAWEAEAEHYDQLFQEQQKLEKLALRRKRMINRIEGILIAIMVYMIIGLAR